MPLKHGHSPEVVHSNIKEMVAAGHPVKQAVAAALAMKRKSKKMAEGGMVDPDDDMDLGTDNAEGAQRSLAEIQEAGRSLPQDIASPEMEMHSDHLAKALYKQSQDMDKLSFAEGGLVEGMEDELNGNEPSMAMPGETDEPMSAEPVHPAPPEHAAVSLSEAQKAAIMERKRKRKFL